MKKIFINSLKGMEIIVWLLSILTFPVVMLVILVHNLIELYQKIYKEFPEIVWIYISSVICYFLPFQLSVFFISGTFILVWLSIEEENNKIIDKNVSK